MNPKSLSGYDYSVYDGIDYRIKPDPGTSEVERLPKFEFQWNSSLVDAQAQRLKEQQQTERPGIPNVREPLTDADLIPVSETSDPAERYGHLRQFMFSGIEVFAQDGSDITNLIIAFPGVNDNSGVSDMLAIDPPNGPNDMTGVKDGKATARGPYLEHTARWLRGIIPDVIKQSGWGVVTLTNFQSCEHMDLAEAQIAALVHSLRQQNTTNGFSDHAINVVFMGHSSGGLTATRMVNHALDGLSGIQSSPVPQEAGLIPSGVIYVDALKNADDLSEGFRGLFDLGNREILGLPVYGAAARITRDLMRRTGRRPGRKAINIEKMILGVMDMMRFVKEVTVAMPEETKKLGNRQNARNIGTHYVDLGLDPTQPKGDLNSFVLPHAVDGFREALPGMTDNIVPAVSHGMHPQYVEAMTPHLLEAIRNVIDDQNAFTSRHTQDATDQKAS